MEHINTSGLTKGKYLLNIRLNYAGQKDSASTEKVFYVEGGILQTIQRLFSNTSVKTGIIAIMTIVLFIWIYSKNANSIMKDDVNNKSKELDKYDVVKKR